MLSSARSKSISNTSSIIMSQKVYTFVSDGENECEAIYDENGKFVRGWQPGDDISRVLRDILAPLGIQLVCKDIEVENGEYPAKI